MLIGSTDSEAPVLWPPDAKNHLEKTLMLGKIEGRRIRGRQRMKCLDAFADSVGMSLSQLQETEKDKEAWHAVVHGIGHSSVTEQLYPDSDYITEILR